MFCDFGGKEGKENRGRDSETVRTSKRISRKKSLDSRSKRKCKIGERNDGAVVRFVVKRTRTGRVRVRTERRKHASTKGEKMGLDRLPLTRQGDGICIHECNTSVLRACKVEGLGEKANAVLPVVIRNEWRANYVSLKYGHLVIVIAHFTL